MNDDRRSKMHGTPVSKEEVLAELGDPAGWSRQSRKLEYARHLKRGETEPGIGGLRGCGRVGGHISFLEKERAVPLGTGTGLVSEAENMRILALAVAEIDEELAACRVRLAELEKSPDAVRAYLDDMRSWLEYLRKTGKSDPELEDLDELRDMTIESNAAWDREVAGLEADIVRYEALLAALS
ncbi:MAG TPA: hypothetical protein VL500_05185 [Candidatus Eisenbacteria bacterium]|nr:hypothetical protein [Candidatus Eisenbacteria bacterium]